MKGYRFTLSTSHWELKLSTNVLSFPNAHKPSACYSHWDLMKLKSGLLFYHVKGPLCYELKENMSMSGLPFLCDSWPFFIESPTSALIMRCILCGTLGMQLRSYGYSVYSSKATISPSSCQ